LHVLGERGHASSISICSFLPDYPDSPFFAIPAQRIRALQDRDQFVVAVFWEVLADQAVHSISDRDLAQFDPPIYSPKLKGLLSTAKSNVHPAYLLIALSFLRETDRFVREHIMTIGSSVLAMLQNPTGPLFERICSSMSEALPLHHRPDSIRAYVPHGDNYRLQPNLAFVDVWASTARDTLANYLGDSLRR
jgi:hypothetical protein